MTRVMCCISKRKTIIYFKKYCIRTRKYTRTRDDKNRTTLNFSIDFSVRVAWGQRNRACLVFNCYGTPSGNCQRSTSASIPWTPVERQRPDGSATTRRDALFFARRRAPPGGGAQRRTVRARRKSRRPSAQERACHAAAERWSSHSIQLPRPMPIAAGENSKRKTEMSKHLPGVFQPCLLA